MAEELAFDWQALVKKPSEQSKMNFALLYGPPGGGKTYTAATVSQIAEMTPVIILDTEGSTIGAIKSIPNGDDNIDIIPVSTAEGFDMAFNAAVNGELGKDYKAIIIDTFDVAQERKLKQITERLETEGRGDDGYAKWGELKQWSNDIAEKMRDMEQFGIMVTHVKREQQESGAMFDLIALAGGAKDTIPGIPDIVAFVERDEEVTFAHFEASKRRVSKNRHGLPATMEDPSFEKIYRDFVVAKNKEN